MKYNRRERPPESARSKPLLRILREYFEMIENGTKTFEIRKEAEVANINPGQVIVLARGDNSNIEVKVIAKTIYKDIRTTLDALDTNKVLDKALPGSKRAEAEEKIKNIYANYSGRVAVLEIKKIQQELT